jgi:hypothetical protein
VSFRDLSLQLSDEGNNLELRYLILVRRLALDALTRVVLLSPVRLPPKPGSKRRRIPGGRLRGGWQLGLNATPQGVPATKDESGSATIAANQGKAESVSLGDVVHLANNVAYAPIIDEGRKTATVTVRRGGKAVTFSRQQGSIQALRGMTLVAAEELRASYGGRVV